MVSQYDTELKTQDRKCIIPCFYLILSIFLVISQVLFCAVRSDKGSLLFGLLLLRLNELLIHVPHLLGELQLLLVSLSLRVVD